MENEELSVIVWCLPDPQMNIARLRVVNVLTGEEVRLKTGAFILRVALDAKKAVTRCYIRHIVSGRECHVQSGPKLRAFVEDCLLMNGESKSTDASKE